MGSVLPGQFDNGRLRRLLKPFGSHLYVYKKPPTSGEAVAKFHGSLLKLMNRKSITGNGPRIVDYAICREG